jgi:hypothetical protein
MLQVIKINIAAQQKKNARLNQMKSNFYVFGMCSSFSLAPDCVITAQHALRALTKFAILITTH